MNKVKMITNMLNAGSFMIMIAAISATIKKAINWLKALSRPKVVAS